MEWGRGEARENREEIFDGIARVVGASRCEFLGRAVAVGDSDRSHSVRAGGFDVELAVAYHERGRGIEGLLFEETTEQGGLSVMERSGRIRVHGEKVAAQGKFFQDPRGKIFALGGADEELPARGLEALQQLMDAWVDGVLLPAGGSVTQAVVVQQGGPARSLASGIRRSMESSAGGPMNQSRGPVWAMPWASRVLVRHPRIPGFESVSVPSRSNMADLRIIMGSVSLAAKPRRPGTLAKCTC